MSILISPQWYVLVFFSSSSKQAGLCTVVIFCVYLLPYDLVIIDVAYVRCSVWSSHVELDCGAGYYSYLIVKYTTYQLI